MGCGDIFIDPIGTLISDAIGFNSPMDYALSSPGDWGSMWKEDWRAFKHLMVPDMRRDRDAMVNSAVTSRRWIYGTCRVSGQLSFATSSGAQNEQFHFIVILSGCQASSFGDVTLDNRPIADYGAKASYRLFDGTQTAACDEMIAASAGLWTEAHKLRGCAYIYLCLTYDEALFPSGTPVVRVVVNGKPVYDPRTGLTAHSYNPAICARDYMLTSEIEGGMGCTPDEVNEPSIIVAADTCDEWVYANAEGTLFERRYACEGAFNIDGTPKKILDALLQSMVGDAVFTQGQWHVFAGACGSTENLVTIDESWLNGGISFKLGASKSEKINTIKGTFVDPTDYWAAKGFPPITSDIYIAEDGNEELSQDLTLNFTTAPGRSQRIAKIIMERTRRGFAVEYPCNFKAFKIVPFQLVRLNNTLLGINQKLMRVMDWTFSGLGGIKLSLIEEDPAIYSWEPGDMIELPEIPLTNLPNPLVVPAPINADITESLVIGPTGTVVVRASFSWTSGTIYATDYDIYIDGVFKLTTRGTAANIDDLTAGWHNFSVEARNSFGSVSPRVTREYKVLGKTAPPADITGLSISYQSGFAYLVWDKSADLDVLISGSIVINHTPRTSGATWYNSNTIGRFAGSATSAVVPAAAGTYLIRAEDSSGNQSVNAVSVLSEPPSTLILTEVASCSEAPGFSGVKTGCTVISNQLVLSVLSNFDSLPGNLDDLPGDLDSQTGTQTGTYDFAAPLTLTSPQSIILSASLESEILSLFSDFDSMVGDLDNWGPFDGGDPNAAAAFLLVSTSVNGIAWSSWKPFVAGEYYAKSVKFRLQLYSYSPNYTIGVTAAQVAINMVDRLQSGDATALTTGPVHVTFPTAFYTSAPHLSFSIYDAVAGDYCFPTNVTATGFDVEVRDQSNIPIQRVINWFAKGY